ncbi:MAG: N-6 DNA methylase [Promethearchaeota archaeon]|nr:MAG: N-6 DNA methylase [Candidatus Lokiarchaeota archaeon]
MMSKVDLKFKTYIDLFDLAIQSKNHQLLRKLLKLLKEKESLFLESYNKRKTEGVYYTNEDLSKFIISKSIIEIINKNINYRNTDSEIKNLNELNLLNQPVKREIIEILLNMSICDPACGSGVFLISAANVLFELIQNLSEMINPSEIKTIILRNIYGLDINPYAIKLCSLKLFAWFYKNIELNNEEPFSFIFSNLKVENSLFSRDWPKKLFNKKNFDIIVGNPPYGNILSKEEKNILKNQNLFYNDIYCAFLIKSLDWIDSGIIGFLLPKSFLLRQGYIKFRNNLLDKASLLKIYDIGAKVFKKATNEVQILIYQNKTNQEYNLEVFNYPEYRNITYLNQKFDKLRVCFNMECPLSLKSKKLYPYTFKKTCPFCGTTTAELNRIRIKPNELLHQLIEKIEKIGDLNYLNHINFPKMIRGEEETGLKLVRRKLRKDTSGSCFFISARTDFSYYTIKKTKSFNLEELDTNVLKGDDYEYYIKPKLLIKHNNIIPEAIYTEENVCFTSSVYSLLHDDDNELKYICAVLNSALIQFYCTYAINNQKDTTINLNQYMIRHLPFIKNTNEIKIKIAEKVDTIINLLSVNEGITNEHTNQLLREIDDIIFNLYKVSEEERNLIIAITKNQIKHFKKIYGP